MVYQNQLEIQKDEGVAEEKQCGLDAATGSQRWSWLNLSFPALAALFLAVRLPWVFTIPMVEAPDEYAHYWVINFLKEHWRLPGSAEVAAGGPSAVYGSLPQLGYLPHVLFSAAVPSYWVPLAERFGSLCMGVVLLYAAWSTGRIIFSKNPLLAAALPLLVLFHPQMVFLHSYANCDATATAISATLILLMLHTLRDGLTIRRTAIMGLLAGWLALTKYSALAMLPVLALAVVSACIMHGTALTVSIPAILLGSALAATTCGWWFWRNYHEFNGDFLGTKTMYNTWATTFHRELHYYLSPWRIIKDIRWWRMMFFSFWGMFGYMNKYMWRPVYLAYIGFLVAASAGVVAIMANYIFSAVRRFAQRTNAWGKEEKINTLIWICLSLVALINLSSMIWASTQNLGGPQGRYLFNSELPVLALMLAGLNCSKKFGSKLVVTFLVFNVLVTVGTWLWLFQMYGGLRLSPL